MRAQLEAAGAGPGACRLPDLVVFEVSGGAARATLQRLLAQDVASLAEGESRLALLLAPRGQCRALMTVAAVDGRLLLVAPPGRSDELRALLEPYLQLSRCRLETVRHGGVAVLGRGWRDAPAGFGELRQAGVSGAVRSTGEGAGAALWFPAALLGLHDATLVVGDGGALDEVTARLACVPVGPELLELERVRCGFPGWGAELVEAFLPHEIGLERVAVSTRKGCYIGQETMARLETYGHPNRCLVGLHQLGDGPAVPGPPAELIAEGEDRPRGTLTSWVRHPLGGGFGLAVVRRPLAVPGTVLAAGPLRFRVAPFPLW